METFPQHFEQPLILFSHNAEIHHHINRLPMYTKTRRGTKNDDQVTPNRFQRFGMRERNPAPKQDKTRKPRCTRWKPGHPQGGGGRKHTVSPSHPPHTPPRLNPRNALNSAMKQLRLVKTTQHAPVVFRTQPHSFVNLTFPRAGHAGIIPPDLVSPLKNAAHQTRTCPTTHQGCKAWPSNQRPHQEEHTTPS